MSVETITPIVWVVFAGVCCAAFYAFYQKRIVGDLLRALIAAGADCAENAKTLSEIGYGKGVRAVYDRLIAAGADAKLKLYPGGRHEMHNEINRDEVFGDLVAFLTEVLG